jgi:hypothetical protein
MASPLVPPLLRQRNMELDKIGGRQFSSRQGERSRKLSTNTPRDMKGVRASVPLFHVAREFALRTTSDRRQNHCAKESFLTCPFNAVFGVSRSMTSSINRAMVMRTSLEE